MGKYTLDLCFKAKNKEAADIIAYNLVNKMEDFIWICYEKGKVMYTDI